MFITQLKEIVGIYNRAGSAIILSLSEGVVQTAKGIGFVLLGVGILISFPVLWAVPIAKSIYSYNIDKYRNAPTLAKMAEAGEYDTHRLKQYQDVLKKKVELYPNSFYVDTLKTIELQLATQKISS